MGHSGHAARPNLFLVGAPRCGTTAMAGYLSEPPDVFMYRKEFHYFGSDNPKASYTLARSIWKRRVRPPQLSAPVLGVSSQTRVYDDGAEGRARNTDSHARPSQAAQSFVAMATKDLPPQCFGQLSLAAGSGRTTRAPSMARGVTHQNDLQTIIYAASMSP
jgi:hypothetical protein